MVGGRQSSLCYAAALTLVLSSSPSVAQEAPGPNCRRASKIEYKSAKELYLLRNQFGIYLKNGPFWHRHYWYCRA